MAEKDEKKVSVRPLWHPFFSFPSWLEEWKWPDFAGHSGVSISEDDNNVYVEAHLPGLKPENIDINFENGILWIRGEKKEEEKDKKKRYYRKASSSFSYQVQVPGSLDGKKEPEATYNDGIMKITFAKAKAGTGSKKINIKSK